MATTTTTTTTTTTATATTIDDAAGRIATARRAISHGQARRAIARAIEATTEDARGDCAARDRALQALWDEVGYWADSNSAAVVRGEALPPRMLRRPGGGALPWARRWQAAEEWAACV
jgi:hypothetical protein